jgi:excinuclease ABC subunit C
MVSRGRKSPPAKPFKPDNPHLEALRKRVASASTAPGIYRWLNDKGDVLYVGKAKNLRKRLTSYVQQKRGSQDGPWRRSFLTQIADLDVTVCNTELEALMLETNLIKQLRPKYNVLMKDDKHYLYIRITVKDPFPRIETVRKIVDDGSKHFGPYVSGDEARRTLELLRKVYPFRTCRMEIEPQSSPLTAHSSPLPLEVVCTHKDRTTPCLDFHIEQCSAPCTGRRTPEQYYKESIEGVIAFLRGDRDTVKHLLTERMKVAATEKKFEYAAQLRNHLSTLERMQKEKQLASDTTGEDSDVFGVALLSGRAHVMVLQRRGGKLIGEHHHELKGQPESEQDTLEQFLVQYYDDGIDIPPQMILPFALESKETVEEWLKVKRGSKVQLLIPERGTKSALVELAQKNAHEKAKQQEIKWEAEKANTEAALEGLTTALELPDLPRRIEGYDISHLGGTETVGSMVVMVNGKTKNDHYRSFTIRTMGKGQVDDYRALQEVLKRRLRRFCEDVPADEQKWHEQGVTFGRGRKAELEHLQARHRVSPSPEESPPDPAQYLVARQDDHPIAFCRLIEHSPTMAELRDLHVDETWQGRHLDQFLLRKLLRSVKKGKVYTTIDPAHELAYGSLGFRYVLKSPKQLSPADDQ